MPQTARAGLVRALRESARRALPAFHISASTTQFAYRFDESFEMQSSGAIASRFEFRPCRSRAEFCTQSPTRPLRKPLYRASAHALAELDSRGRAKPGPSQQRPEDVTEARA